MLCGQVVTGLNIQRDRYPVSTDIEAQVRMIKRGVTNTDFALYHTVPRHIILGGSRKYDTLPDIVDEVVIAMRGSTIWMTHT